MAVVKIRSVNFGPISDWALWTRETQHIQVDRLLVLQTFAATVMNKLCPYVLLVELLGPGNPVDDRLCSGLSWTLLTAAFLRDADTIKAVLDRSCGTDLSEGLLNTALEVAVLQGDFEAVGMFLPRNTNPNKTGSCKGHQSTNGGALRQACTASHESIVDLPLTTLLWDQEERAAI